MTVCSYSLWRVSEEPDEAGDGEPGEAGDAAGLLTGPMPDELVV